VADAPSDIRRGLVGVVADTTSISMVNEATNSLLYRGYPVQELCASCSFEEVAYLIWHGNLPTEAELAAFTAEERAARQVPDTLFEVLETLPTTCHPMDVLRTGVAWLGASDPREDDNSPEANLAKSIDMMAKLPAIVAFEQRRRRGEKRIAADASLSFSENFFQMCFGEIPPAEVIKCFEISMILYAEHSFNASTFSARVIISTLSDIYSAVTGAIGALKGPLHGGANEAVMAMMEEIGDPNIAGQWLRDALAAKRKVMGFGHRVYKHGDSRVPTMYAALEEMVRLRGGEELLLMYKNLADTMEQDKAIHPNLDFPSAPAYHLMGFDIPTFTPLFVMSRITGWTAHIIEQLSQNSLIRPLSQYVGEPERHVSR